MRGSVSVNGFAATLYNRLLTPTVNGVYSPYSISAAVAMLSAGAAGETLTEIQEALRFPKVPTELHADHCGLEQQLAKRNHGPPASAQLPQPGKKPSPATLRWLQQSGVAQRLRVTNDIWLTRQASPELPVAALVGRYYGSSAHLIAFDTCPDGARRVINHHIKRATEGMIPDLLTHDSVTPQTKLVLTNAVYFKGRWERGFTLSDTKPRPFHSIDASTRHVPTMRRREPTSYLRRRDLTVVALPYRPGEVELVLLLPPAGRFKEFVRRLTPARLDEYLTLPLKSETIDLRFPKFSFDTHAALVPQLEALGMQRAFEPRRAELPGWSGGSADLYVSNVLHAARIIVDEVGTEAAAATAVLGKDVSKVTVDTPPYPIVKVDRPFVFVIRDRPTGVVLFIGQVVSLG